MTSTAKQFLAMDAGDQRQFLASELADWIEAEFWSTPRAEQYYRRAKILAHRVGMNFVDVMEELLGDAKAIVQRRGAAQARS